MKSATIDAHHHFWPYKPEEYGWMREGMERIQRDFLPLDLMPEIESAKIDGTVAVQARQTLYETKWLLRLADEHEFIRGVVGMGAFSCDISGG